MNVTNTRPIDKVSLKGTKTWADLNNQDGKRPESIKVYLLADGQPALDENGKEIKPIKVKGALSADTWNYEFKDVPKHRAVKSSDTIKEATPIIYTVKEEVSKELINEKYKISEDGMNITNTRPLDKVSFKGTKVWNDANNQDNIRPENITVNLFADGEKVASQVVTGSHGFEEKDATWSYEFKDLPKHAKGKVGKEIKYTVTEEKIANYETKVKGSTITNSYKPQETRLFVEKVWDDASNQDGKRPQDIAIQLYADGKALTGKKITLSSANKWKASIKNLPVNLKGKDIKYSVKEISEAAEKVGYKAKIAYSANKENKQDKDVIVTNSREIETVNISGNKTWNDANNQDGIRPTAVTVKLLADGKEIDSQEVNDATKWTYSFTDLPKYKAGEEGQEIKYTVEESAAGYQAEMTKTDAGFDIVNTHEVELISIPVNKIWNDANNQDGVRPTEIKFNLYGEDKENPIATKILAGDMTADEWTFTFKGLEKYAKDKVGEAVEYTLVEETVDGAKQLKGYEQPIIKGSTKEGFNVTNTHKVELISIPVTKIWNDADNKDGIRPESIKVSLLADGKQAKDAKGKEIVATISGDMKVNEWKDTFKDLPKYANGKEIKYSVEEAEVAKGYEATYSEDTFTITNSHTPKEAPTTGTKSTNNKSTNNTSGSLPKTGEAENAALVNLGITMMIIVFMSYAGLNQRRKAKED